MQKLQDSVFSILKTTSLSPAVFSFLQPTDDFAETPLGGILRDTKYGWLALGPKFCVVDLRNGLKVAARTFGNGSSHISVTSVIELPHPLTSGSQQLVISLEADDRGLICVLHVNGSQILHCIETDVIITELALCDDVTNGPLTCFDGLLMAGTQKGDVLVIDLNRNSLIQALTDLTEGNGDLIKNESDPATLSIISLKSLHKYERQGTLVNNNEHFTIVLNDDSFIDNQFVFRNPDSTVRMRAQKDHVRVTVVQYIPQLGSLAVGYNFGAFQLWNIFDLTLEYTSQVNVECLPVTHFGFQEPCDDPRAFCYLWVVFSVTNRFEEHEFPLAVMYSLTYQGKRMLADNKCLYQEFSSATICFQVELGSMDHTHVIGGRCISTHTFSINTMLGEEGEDTMLNLCQLVWECWGEQSKSLHYGMLMFDLDQWYKDQMPATYQLQSNTFMSTAWCSDLGRGSLTLDLRLDPSSLSPYSHATRLEEHFYPNSLLYNCVCLNTSGAIKLHTVGIQRQIVSSISSTGPSCLLSPSRLYTACMSAGLMPAYITPDSDTSVDEQRKFLLSVALEARMSQFLKRCAQDWATGTHTGVGCTLTFLVDWAWKRAIELKENAKELISPLFTSATLPDRNVIRCLEHCVQQLSQLTGLLDAVLTKCCNLVVPDALSEIEEKYKGIGTVSLYFQVIQWFLRVGLLPERNHPHASVPYPAEQLYAIYKKRRAKLHRIQGDSIEGEPSCVPSSLLYVDQLIINEFGGQAVHQIWTRAGSKCGGLYPPPSLYAMLRLYLLPDISEEHKHSLLLYLLLDYSMLYDDAQYEAVIRRLMQFPPMFGLSTTLVRATQAFWHLDHRDFHFALDQLQCLTGNTLSNWQHQVVLSSLLAQKKSQAALQYLHVRKPAPVKAKIGDSNPVNGQDKLEDWRSYCNLYLARGLVFEALDVVRMCSQNAANVEDRSHVLDYFFKGCRNSGQLSNVLQMTLLPFEEELFIKFLKECNEPPTSDLLIMYYLQQARFLEAEQYNKQMKSKSKWREMCRSVESMSDLLERESARDVIVEVMCSSVPRIANTVAKFSTHEFEPHVRKPKPMSVYVKAKSPKNTFTYKSSFIQDTIENASETWINKPKLKKGLKRALSIDETPFICTPKLIKTKSIFEKQTDSAQSKRAKLELSPKTPRNRAAVKVSDKLSEQIATLLEMPCVESPKHNLRSETPHSILKTRRLEYQERDISSPTESRYLEESDDDMETASNHTHYSDSTNKHLRFTIPTPSVIVPTPVAIPVPAQPSQDTTDHGQESSPPKSMESPPKKFAAERDPLRRSYKDKVKARKSSIFANSSLSDDPNTSLESIADIPVTLINPKYTGERRSYTKSPEPETQSGIDVRVPSSVIGTDDASFETSIELSFVSKTPKGRRGIHASGTTPVANRSCSITPERYDSPIAPLVTRSARSRSRTPEISPRTSPLSAIPEMPRLELNADSHPTSTLMSKPIRHRLRTPDKVEKVMELSRLEVIKETPGTVELPVPAPRRNLRSRSRTPEIEQVEQPVLERPRELRSRSKTPEKLMSPKKENIVKNRKSLSRIVLEANAFAKTKQTDEKCENVIECTPMKSSKQISRLMDVTFSPINKSVLQSSNESILVEKNTDAEANLPAFSNTIYTEESILHSYESSGVEQSDTRAHNEKDNMQYTLNDIGKSVLHSYDSSVDTSAKETQNVESKDNKDLANQSLLTSDSEIEEKDWNVERDANVIQQEKNKIVEIEWEINEIEGDLSDDGCRETDSGNEAAEAESEESSEDDSDSSEEDDSNDGGEDVISIEDSDSDIDQLQIDDQAEVTEPTAEVVEMEVEKEDKQMVHNVAEKADSNQIFESMEVSTDVMNQGQISLMTDDNSELEQSNPKCHGEDSTQIKDIDQADVQVDETLFKAPSEEEVAHVEDDKATPLIEVEIGQGDNSNKEALAEEPETDVKVDVKTAADEKVLDEVKTPPNKSKQESTDDEIPNTRPVQSESPVVDTSLSMLETPEVDSPRTRRRSKTPNIERRILTRRASRELSEMDDSFVPFEELTPRRRTRSTKKDDGNSSVTSDSSTKSIHTKASEEDKRKGRKIISTELTVIPEVEDSTKSQDIEEYSTSRRLTRHQKAQLGKEDHEGTPDRDDYQNSPVSASKVRGRRAMSEVKTVVKAARIGRSSSVDVGAGEPGAESPLATPIRGRRASFTRAIEALHTPKGRRASTDVKKDIDSNPASPAGTKSVNTPTRRSSRRASTQSASNTPEPGKRNRKGADKDRDVQE